MTMSWIDIAGTLLFILPCFLVLYITFGDRLRTPCLSNALLAMGIFLVISIFSSRLYLYADSIPLIRSLISSLAMLSGVFIVKAALPYSFAQCFFFIVVVKCYSDSVTLLSASIDFIINGTITETLNETSLSAHFIVAAVSLPLICLFFTKLLRPAIDNTERLPFWRFLWCIPLCNSTLYTMVIDPRFSPRNPGHELYFTPYVWILLTFLTYAIILKMIVETTENAALQERLHISETQISAQQKQTEILRQKIEESKKARHDLRHHLLAMQGYVSANDYEGLTAYLDSYIWVMKPESPDLYCQNTGIDAMIRYYADLGTEHHVKSTVNAFVPESLSFSIMDLSIILGNLLENAIEACIRQKSESRYMNLNISMVSDKIMTIIIENSFDGDIVEKDGIFFSSKQEGRAGIGISSVRSIVEKYHGVLKFEYGDHIFKVSVLLNSCPEETS